MPEFLHQEDGEIFLTGHRIALQHILVPYQEGASPEMLVQLYPTLSLAMAYRVIAFYLDNRQEVDEYLIDIQAEIAKQASMPRRGPTVAELKKRLDGLQPAKSA